MWHRSNRNKAQFYSHPLWNYTAGSKHVVSLPCSGHMLEYSLSQIITFSTTRIEILFWKKEAVSELKDFCDMALLPRYYITEKSKAYWFPVCICSHLTVNVVSYGNTWCIGCEAYLIPWLKTSRNLGSNPKFICRWVPEGKFQWSMC